MAGVVYEIDKQEIVETGIYQESETGMPVFDAEGIYLGKVAYIYKSKDIALPRVVPAGDFAEISAPESFLVEEDGGLVVGNGIHKQDYFVMSDQIAEVKEMGIFLNCYQRELIHL